MKHNEMEEARKRAQAHDMTREEFREQTPPELLGPEEDAHSLAIALRLAQAQNKDLREAAAKLECERDKSIKAEHDTLAALIEARREAEEMLKPFGMDDELSWRQ